MELSGFSSGIYQTCLWVSKLAYVNFLWILFTLLGLGIFGFMPATVALFSITRKWMMGVQNVSIFSQFWKTYREEFLKSNFLGSILIVIGFILFLDLAYLPTTGLFFTVMRVGLTICGLLFLIVLLYVFPMYVHYDWNNRRYIKYALLLGAAYPHLTVSMLAGIALLYLFLVAIPGLIPFFSVSVLAVVIMGGSFLVFKKAKLIQRVDLK